MAEELGFTSTPQGLDPAASGYCTVFRTPGVTKTLQFELESLSVYRPQFLPGSPNEDENPTNYAHQIINDGRRRWHVVSRTGYAGADYTGRNNHFSHHVLLGPEDRPASGPAWMASRKGFLDRQWSGTTQVLSAARSLPLDDGHGEPGVCRIWEETVGDAGWAGRLVEAYLASPSLPCYLIYRAGQAILPLIVEALALLPAEQRWNVTFCTYYTAGGKNDSLWRGVLEGTREAEQALRGPDRARVFDVRSRELGPAPASEWTTYARTGEPPERAGPSGGNGGYSGRGNGGVRTNTVVVPKRRSAAPMEEFASPAAALGAAPARVAASAPPKPPPPPQDQPKSVAMLIVIAAVIGVPVAMAISGGLAWNVATRHERQRQDVIQQQIREDLGQKAQAALDQQNQKGHDRRAKQEDQAKEVRAGEARQREQLEKYLAAVQADVSILQMLLDNELRENERLKGEVKQLKEQQTQPGGKKTTTAHQSRDKSDEPSDASATKETDKSAK